MRSLHRVALPYLLYPLASVAIAADAPRFELVAYGVFDDVTTTGRIAAPGSSDGSIGVVSEYDVARPTVVTDRIPAQTGVRFGYTFVVTNRGTFDSVPVEVRVTHPPLELPDGGRVTVDNWPMQAQGIPRLTGWRFDHDYELVPGAWTIAVLHEGAVVVEKTFCVGAPSERCDAP